MARKSKHVLLFLRAASVRLEEAAVLRAAKRSLGAVYLAGYAVECQLKALLLAQHDEHEQQRLIDEEFCGQVAHNFDWLLTRYRAAGGSPSPKPVTVALPALRRWQTDLRYAPTARYDGDVGEFFAAVTVLLAWAEGRV